MTATNHVLTGAVFAAATVNRWPLWIVLSVAFLLHFVLDSLPHFGQRTDDKAAMTRLKWLLPLDAAVAAAVLLTIALVRPDHWVIYGFGGILCASPDLWSASRFIRFLRTSDPRRNQDRFSRFHTSLQWGERLWGAWVELAWFLVFGSLLLQRL